MDEDKLKKFREAGINYEEALERFDGDEELLCIFMDKFRRDTSFLNLTEALKKKDMEEMYRAVHTLKGISSQIGLAALFDVSAEMCLKYRNGDMEGFSKDYESVKSVYYRTLEALC